MDDDQTTPSAAPENKRINRLRTSDLESTPGGQSRGRRGSGATSRSSSPTGSEDTALARDSESEQQSGRTTRSRRRSGKSAVPSTPAAAETESAPSSPAASGTETPEDELWKPDPKVWKKQVQIWSSIVTFFT